MLTYNFRRQTPVCGALAYCRDGRIADWPPIGQSLPMVYQVILIVVATALLIVPQWFSTYTKRQHSERLAALRNGASEKYCEERRSLETYRPRGASWPYRLFGLAMMAFAISSLVFRH